MAYKKTLAERVRLFKEDPTNRREMRRILENPVLIEAMELLREMYLPNVSLILPSADTTALSIALKHTLQAGAHDYAEELFRLCDEPEKVEEPARAGRLLAEGETPPHDPRTRRGRPA